MRPRERLRSWEGGGSGGGSVGHIGNAETGEGAEEGRFHRQERVPMYATCKF